MPQCPVCKSVETVKIVLGNGQETDVIHAISEDVTNPSSRKIEFVICKSCGVSYTRVV